MSDFFLICPCCDFMQADPDGVTCEECGAQLYPSGDDRESPRESSPRIQERRFTVGKVTGYAIPTNGTTDGHREQTIWYVYDRAYGYRALKKFHGSRAETRAYEFASSLNARHGAA